MSSNRRPWYKWYPKDFITDEKVQSLSANSELVYRRLLDVMWQSNRCFLLNVCLRLANTAGRGLTLDEFKKSWDEIQTPGFELFKTTDDGKWIYSKRLQEQLQDVENKEKAGKKGGQASAKQRASKRQAEVKQAVKQKATDTDTDTDIKEIYKEKKKQPKKFIPPTLPEVVKYFFENGYSIESAKKAFEYYSVANWKDSKGNQVQNWKQKMVAVWFKDENRALVNQKTLKPLTREDIENGTLEKNPTAIN